ncbi:MAG: septum formation initiator family protein [Actinomycetota bacterium]|jgi:cell division protein DivIC|nr:septum formation initiator family protein [Actinomycetota bacterium]
MKAERRGLGVRSFVVLSFVVALVAGAAGVFPFRQIIAQRRSVELAEAQLDALIEENRRLEQQIGALESPQEVERLAREQFGLVMPGDVAYVAVVPPGSEPADLEPDVALEKSPPWWRKVWNFLTGGDLVEE